MNEVRLFVDKSTVLVSPKRATTGNIWIRLNDADFPAPHWNDFVVVTCCFWIQGAIDLLRRDINKLRIPFMEGPYSVDIEWLDFSRLRICAYSGANRSKIEGFAETAANDFFEQLHSEATGLVEMCKSLGDSNSDLENLESCLSVLSNQLKR
jgi:hypothetical protein